MTYEKTPYAGGTDPVTALITLQSLGADAVGCNVQPARKNGGIYRGHETYATVPLVAKPNPEFRVSKAGKPSLKWTRKPFASFGSKLPNRSQYAGRLLRNNTGAYQKLARATAGSKQYYLWENQSAVEFGARIFAFRWKSASFHSRERINPTGKKPCSRNLSKGKCPSFAKWRRSRKSKAQIYWILMSVNPASMNKNN